MTYSYGPQWETLLNELDEYLAAREDVRDGEDGRQLPNQAMSLLTSLRYLRDAPRTEERRISVPVHDCPCGNVGFYVVPNRNTGDPEQEQCEFCYTVENSRFNVQRISTLPSPRGEPTATARTDNRGYRCSICLAESAVWMDCIAEGCPHNGREPQGGGNG